jgi:hypothetical membrane protein
MDRASDSEQAPPVPRVPPSIRRMFWLVDAAIVLYLVLDLVAQLLPPHYSAVSQAESDLAVGPYGWIMTLNFVNRGVLSLVFAYLFARVARSDPRGWEPYRLGIAGIGVWGIGALVLAAFPTDVPATPVSSHGAVHLVVAIVAFLGGALGVYALSREFDRREVLVRAKPIARGIGVASVLLCVVELGLPFVAPHAAARIGGVTERLFLGSVLAWIFYVALHLAASAEALGEYDPKLPSATGPAS